MGAMRISVSNWATTRRGRRALDRRDPRRRSGELTAPEHRRRPGLGYAMAPPRRPVGGQRHRVEGDPRLRALVAPADRGALRPARSLGLLVAAPRRRPRAGCGCARDELPFLAVFGVVRARVRAAGSTSSRSTGSRSGSRSLIQYLGAAARRALGALRAPRAGAAAGLGSRSALALGGLALDRPTCAGGTLSTAGLALRASRRRPPTCSTSSRRARGRPARPGLAARLRLRLRGALLRGDRSRGGASRGTRVERGRLAARAPRRQHLPVWALWPGWSCSGRPPVPARDRLAPAPAGDPRRDHRDARAGGRDARRAGPGSASRSAPSSSSAALVVLAAIVLAQTARRQRRCRCKLGFMIYKDGSIGPLERGPMG